MTTISVTDRLVGPFLAHRRLAASDDARREALIAALLGVFLDEGFRHLSIDDMARRLRCSKSTLYLIASSKERIIVAVVRGFFRRATERVERRIQRMPAGTAERLQSYLSAITAELAPASVALFADIDAFPATREIYHRNTSAAAARVQELVLDAVPATSRDRAVFIGAVAAQIMEAIHRGDIGRSTGLGDSAAYRALGDLVVSATSADDRLPRPAGTRPTDPSPLFPRSER